MKFSNVEALIARMDEDRSSARAALAQAKNASPPLDLLDLKPI
jgi:hypothetical protein